MIVEQEFEDGVANALGFRIDDKRVLHTTPTKKRSVCPETYRESNVDSGSRGSRVKVEIKPFKILDAVSLPDTRLA